MEVILVEKIRNLGTIGDKVKVKAGFARNFLLPQGKALRVTAENMAELQKKKAELEKIAAEQLAASQKRAAAFMELVLTISAKAGEEGKLYGSIGTREIAQAITDAGHAINKSEVLLPEGPIRMVGEYNIDLQLHGEVMSSVKITVVSEGTTD